MYKTILLAYDGSREGLLALREGALLAKTCDAKVVLLSVIPHATGAVEWAAGVGGDLADETQDYRNLLNDAVVWAKQRGFAPIPKLVVGNPAQSIGKVANEVAADLVVVGHRRKGFLERWWSDSTDTYLSDHVACSILMACNPISDEVLEVALPVVA